MSSIPENNTATVTTKQRATTTLMTTVRKNDIQKFNLLVNDAPEKHVDHSFALCIRDTDPINMQMFKKLLKHPNLSPKGFKWGVDCAIFGRNRDILATLVRDKRFTVDNIVDRLLDC